MSKPTRAACYIRVSKADQAEGYSLDAQERILADYCRSREWPVPILYADRGESAFRKGGKKRPGFQQLLSDAEARRFDVVVIHKLDRFARNTTTALEALAAIQRAGVGFACITLDMDFTSPVGRMVFTMMAGLAEFFSHNLSDEVKKGLVQKRLNGEWLGPLPFGARRDDAGRLTLDEASMPLLAEILDRLPTESPYQIAPDLNARGIPSPRGKAWNPNTMYDMVRGGSWLLDQPEPWPARWQAARWRSRAPSVRRAYLTHMLSGLLRCPCGGSMQYNGPHRDRGDRYRLRCVSARLRPHAPAKNCGRPLRWADVYEAQVEAWLLALPDLSKVPPDDVDPLFADERAAIDEARREVRLHHKAKLINDDEMLAEAAAIEAREAALPWHAAPTRPVGVMVADAQRNWHLFDPAGRNALLRELTDGVLIDGDIATPIPKPFLARALAKVRMAPVG